MELSSEDALAINSDPPKVGGTTSGFKTVLSQLFPKLWIFLTFAALGVRIFEIEALKLINTCTSILSKPVSFNEVRVKKGLIRVDSRPAWLCYTKSHLRGGNLKY